MQLPDIINGLFEAAMGVFGALSVRAIRKHRTVKGVHWGPTAIAGLWGLWNLYYYPHLGQWFSLVASLGIASINLTWLGYAWKYRNNSADVAPVSQPFNPIGQ